MRGRLAAARLLHEAQELLQQHGSPAAVQVGWFRLGAEMIREVSDVERELDLVGAP